LLELILEFTLKTEAALPHCLKRSEVLSCERREISPIQNAVRNIEAKNAELETLERKYRAAWQDTLLTPSPSKPTHNRFSSSGGSSHGSHASKQHDHQNLEKRRSAGQVAVPLNCNPLTMSLNGAVDAPVNGGLPMYRKAFLSREFARQNMNEAASVQRLRQAIDDQVCFLTNLTIMTNDRHEFFQGVLTCTRRLHRQICGHCTTPSSSVRLLFSG
jgi:hypothetical protein